MGYPQLEAFLRRLTRERRVILLGGLAVIAHGFSRPTKDADVWLEPMRAAEEWAEYLRSVCTDFPAVRLAALPGWRPVESAADLSQVAEEVGMIRVLGLECPLDVFRAPNEIDPADFDAMYARATPKDDGVCVPDTIDLLLSKENTGRTSDFHDQNFLEDKIRAEMKLALQTATLEEAEAIFARFCDHVVCEAALASPRSEVRQLGQTWLEKLADSGDLFALEKLGRKLPPLL